MFIKTGQYENMRHIQRPTNTHLVLHYINLFLSYHLKSVYPFRLRGDKPLITQKLKKLRAY